MCKQKSYTEKAQSGVSMPARLRELSVRLALGSRECLHP